jgi:hypothetical protein
VSMPTTHFDYGQLDDVTGQFVRNATKAIQQLGKQTVESIVAIGRHLTEVRERLPHGQWGPWLRSEFGWSDRTARRFMDSHALIKSANLSDLPRLLELPPSSLAQLGAPSTPEPARQSVLTRIAAGNTPTVSQVQMTIHHHKLEQAREAVVNLHAAPIVPVSLPTIRTAPIVPRAAATATEAPDPAAKLMALYDVLCSHDQNVVARRILEHQLRQTDLTPKQKQELTKVLAVLADYSSQQ